jgi:glycosyltransferase involved in cell wall biosynthesis
VVIDYSVIIPAYNEEAYLGHTLDALKKAMATVPLKGEVIVTDNNSTDATAKIAAEHGTKVAFEPVNQISRARNAGARQATGRYLVFVDADTVVAPALLQTALDNLESGSCCGGGVNVGMDVAVSRGAQLVVNFWNLISRTFRLAAGCFVYCRRDDFEASGGFSEKVYAGEEVWLSAALKRIGRKSKRKFIIIRKPMAITSDRKLRWFNTMQHLVLLIILAFFPYLLRFKRVAWYWYRRPETTDNKETK